MALRQLMLRKKIEDMRGRLDELLKTKDALMVRETELESAINEIETPTTEEEKEAVEEQKKVVEQSIEQLEAEQQANAEAIEQTQAEIAKAEEQLSEMEEKTEQPPAEQPEERTRAEVMNRARLFDMSAQESETLLRRDDVKHFLSNVRTCIKEKRAIENVGLTIPEVMLPMLRQIVETNSKLLPYVNLRSVRGTARQVLMGEIMEGVWTDCCAALNEGNLSFFDLDFGCWKVGSFFDICNATLEDSDLSLASEILTAIGIGISKAVDKAIIYGRGTRMPMGIVTSLNQTAEPTDYLPTARPWENLSASNVKAGTGAKGVNLFKEIVQRTKALKNPYYEGGLVWVMNEMTHLDLLVESMDKNLNGAIVAGIADSVMPVIGGTIVEVPFIPDNNIVYGYFGAYTMVERAGRQFATSEHYKFLEDRTVFKGTARYDGKPVIREAFGVLTTDTSEPVEASAIDFPADLANAPEPVTP